MPVFLIFEEIVDSLLTHLEVKILVLSEVFENSPPVKRLRNDVVFEISGAGRTAVRLAEKRLVHREESRSNRIIKITFATFNQRPTKGLFFSDDVGLIVVSFEEMRHSFSAKLNFHRCVGVTSSSPGV